MAKVCAILVFIWAWILPHQRGIDLHGEGVVFKRCDLTENVRQEQIDKGDGDGREVLKNQTVHPGVTLKGTDPRLRNGTFNLRNSLVPCANSLTHPVCTSMDRKIDEGEGSAQQTQDDHIENEPQQVEPHLLPELPLSHLHGESLLLEEQLRSIREKYRRTQVQWNV